MASILRFPRPRSLLRIIPLRTAAEFISFTLLINKVTGFYGILAIFTGYHLNPLQLSHYIYSLVVLAIGAWLATAISPPARTGATIGTVLKNLALAWLYLLDTLINGVYTTLFGLGWFVLLAQQNGHAVKGVPGVGAPGKGTMDDTAGFTSPEVNVTRVEVVAEPAPGLLTGQAATAYATNESGAAGSVGDAVLQSDSIASLTILSVFWLIRIYFGLIMLSYARTVLRQYIANQSTNNINPFAQDTTADADPTMAANPFAVGGAITGWKGRLGRAMIYLPSKRYWLGREEQSGAALSDWERATFGRFGSGQKVLHVRVPSDTGNAERERRARSGTGPPAKMIPPS